jgi:ankyrin repeat protein
MFEIESRCKVLKQLQAMNDEQQPFANRPLHLAVINGDIDAVNALIASTDDIGAFERVERGERRPASACQLAVRLRHFAILKRLLSAPCGAVYFYDLSALNEADDVVRDVVQCFPVEPIFEPHQFTLCHYAALNERENVLAALLAAGAPHSQFASLCLPAHVAARNQNEKVLALLIDSGADVTSMDDQGRSPCHHAAENRNELVLAQLIAAGVDINVMGCKRRESLSDNDDDDDDNDEDEDDTNKLTERPIHVAAANENVRVMARLIDAGVDVNALDSCGWSALQTAVSAGNEAAFDMLLAAGAFLDVNALDGLERSLCHHAASHESLLKKVVALGCNVHTRNRDGGKTPMHVVLESGTAASVCTLLVAGATLDEVTRNGMNACHLAAQNWRANVLELVLSLGFKATACDDRGRSPCQIAVENGRVRNVSMLLDAGESVHVVNLDGDSLLHRASLKEVLPRPQELEIVRLLLQRGADFRLTNDAGETPLHAAKIADVAAVFIACGADINARTRGGQTALQMAFHLRDPAKFATMLVAGAEVHSVEEFLSARKLLLRDRFLAVLDAEGFDVGEDLPALARRNALALIAEREQVLFQLRSYQVCIGLQSLQLPALVTCEILALMFAPRQSTVPFHRMWAVATLVKHFKQKKCEL